MNYCEEDGLHAIKLMAEVYLREIRMSQELLNQGHALSMSRLC